MALLLKGMVGRQRKQYMNKIF